MADRFILNQSEYVLNSGMLYEGSGNCGHWRCIAKVGDQFLIFNDEHPPVHGSERVLRLGTDFNFCKVDLSLNHTCKMCGKSFLRAHFLQHHVLVDHKDHRCDECGDYLGNSQEEIEHFKTKHMEEDRTCVVCNENFDSIEGVQAHMKDFHPKSYNFEKECQEVPELSYGEPGTSLEGNDCGSPKKKARLNGSTETALEQLSKRMSDSISFDTLIDEVTLTTKTVNNKKGQKELRRETLDEEIKKKAGVKSKFKGLSQTLTFPMIVSLGHGNTKTPRRLRYITF